MIFISKSLFQDKSDDIIEKEDDDDDDDDYLEEKPITEPKKKKPIPKDATICECGGYYTYEKNKKTHEETKRNI